MLHRKIILMSAFAIAAIAADVPANKVVDTKWLKDNIDDKNVVLVDLREGKNSSFINKSVPWAVGDMREDRSVISGYISSPTQFERLAQNSGITDDSAIIFYTEGNKTATDYTAATLAVHITEYFGLKNTAILNGGYAAWVKDGGTTVPNPAKPAKTDFTITEINPSDVATLYDVDDAVATGEWVLMDGRTPAQYTGEAAHVKAAKAGHIKDAHNLFIAKFSANKDGIFYINTDKDSVANLINSAGGDVTKPTLWYCNTGWFATGGWFMSKYIVGTEKVKAYDGSILEYSLMPKREILKSDSAQ